MSLFRKNKKSARETMKLQQFVQSLSPMFNMMTLVNVSETIGIESGELLDVLKTKANVVNDDLEEQIDNMIVLIDLVVTDKEFRDKIISKIRLIKYYGTFEMDNESLRGAFSIADSHYVFEMHADEKDVSYSFAKKDNTRLLKGTYKSNESGTSSIKYEESETTIFHLDNNVDSYNNKSMKTIHTFDKNGYEDFRYELESHDNYYINTVTNDKKLHEPSPFENYTDAVYAWRSPKNSIIKREKKQYIYTEEVDYGIRNLDSFLVGRNVTPDSKRLPLGGNFVWFDKELYQDYINGLCTIDEIWENRGHSYQKNK